MDIETSNQIVEIKIVYIPFQPAKRCQTICPKCIPSIVLGHGCSPCYQLAPWSLIINSSLPSLGASQRYGKAPLFVGHGPSSMAMLNFQRVCIFSKSISTSGSLVIWVELGYPNNCKPAARSTSEPLVEIIWKKHPLW
jgi:hypothetical protein